MGIVAAIFIRHADWLIYAALLLAALSLIGWWLNRKQLEATPTELAEQAERILDGSSHGWDVDDFEHSFPATAEAREILHECMKLYGLPEEWHKLDEPQKAGLRELIERLRGLDR